jgi:RNA polymerase sigma factor (sigma-70 family)
MTDFTDDTSHALLRRYRAGDMDAAVALLEALRPALAHYLARRAGDAAEDLLQDTYVIALRSGRRLRGQSSFRAFAFSIAERVLHRRSKRRARRPAFVAEPEAFATGEPSSLALLERRQVYSLLDRAVEGLPDDQRSCVGLLLHDDQTPAEIADTLGVSLSTVATRLQRAKSRLRATLGPIVR